MVDHWTEIAVIMKQHVMPNDAKSANDHVDRLAHRNPARPQFSVIARSLDSQAAIEHWRDWIAPQVPLDPVSMHLVTRTL